MAMVEQGAEVEPAIISRINRLDKVVKHLEEMRGRRSSWESESSPSSGSPSSCSDARSSASLIDVKQHCRTLDDVVSESQRKGTLLYRLSHLEDRLLQLCLQVDKEMHQHNISEQQDPPVTPTKKGLKQLVKSCVKPKYKSKSKSKSK